jgi:hypothetical protein
MFHMFNLNIAIFNSFIMVCNISNLLSYIYLRGNFLSLYSRFYEVTILENTYATDEGKM